MKAIVIDEPWISLILDGKKTWEMRKGSCHQSGLIGLIRRGSGRVVGVARIHGSGPELKTAAEFAKAEPFHCIPVEKQEQAMKDGWTTPWIISDARALSEVVSYHHPKGAVIWVTLPGETAHAVLNRVDSAALKQSEMTQAAASSRSQPPQPTRPANGIVAPVARRQDHASRKRQKVQGRIEGDTAYIPITEGNITHHHIYLHSIIEFFPGTAIGGSNKKQLADQMLQITFSPGRASPVCTDIAGPNRNSIQKTPPHLFFRDRQHTGDFFARSGAQAGDVVKITRNTPTSYTLSLVKKSTG